MFEEIDGSGSWVRVEPISKGWSSDRKYRILTENGVSLLLRISDVAQYSEKKKEYEIICAYSKLDFCMSMPVGFGFCNGGESVYMLLTWVEGRDLEEALPTLCREEQYRLGREAGEILRRLHSVAVDPADIPVETKKAKKLKQLARYEASQVRIDGDACAIAYVKEHIDLIWRQPPAYLHGDFHPGNLIYTPDGKIGVIDFNRWEVGDPYEEFYKLQSFGVEVSVPYCIGQIEAYFNDRIPEEFWDTLAVYVAQSSLFSIKWAEKFGQRDVDGMVARCRRAMWDYDSFRQQIPRWFSER